MSVKREIRQCWEIIFLNIAELLRWELRYLDSEYLDQTLAQFPKKAVAFFDTNEWEHQMVITVTNDIIGEEKQQMLCQEVSRLESIER